jgi:hypothetical protein
MGRALTKNNRLYLPLLFLFLTVFPVTYFAFQTFTSPQLYSLACLFVLLSLSFLTTIFAVQKHGLLEFCPSGLKNLLLNVNILDWLTDTTFFESNILPILPLLLNPSHEEIIEVLRPMSPLWQRTILQPGGFGRLFPRHVQKWLHPTLLKERPQLQLPPKPSHLLLALPQADSRIIISRQIKQAFRDVISATNPKALWRTSGVALSVLLFMIWRSRLARQTSVSIARALAFLGLVGTSVGSALVAYYGEKMRQLQTLLQKKIEERGLDTTIRGGPGAKQVLSEEWCK